MDSSNRISPFSNGNWGWDNEKNCLVFLSRDILRTPSAATATSTAQAAKHVTTDIKFRETVDALEQIRFRRLYQRVCKPNEPEVITIQDVKDVAMFMADADSLTIEFVNYFHIPTMDRFLRSLIIYFQYYFQVWENLMLKREESKRKLWQPVVTTVENVIRDDLADLRSMVAREYCSVLLGIEDAKSYHHMNNKNNDSLSDKDRRLFEILICMAVRVVWIALQRKYLSLIEIEVHRLLRTDSFNMIVHRGLRGGTAFSTTPGEQRVLAGAANIPEKKLLQRSPAAKELLFANHDHRMLAIGFLEIEPSDERLRYLEAAYAAPEELLIDMKVTVGVLGIPRNELDAMIMPKERTSEDINKAAREMPEFKLPPVKQHRDEKMPQQFPQKPCRYKETLQTTLARSRQMKLWRNYVLEGGMAETEVKNQLLESQSYILASCTSLSGRVS